MKFTFEVPIKVASTLNLREHWAAKMRRTRIQKNAVSAKFPKQQLSPVVVVRLVRVGQRQLDGDNLQGALKTVRDAVAAKLGIDDGSPLVRWEYGQAKGEGKQNSVRITVEEAWTKPAT